MYEDLGLRGYPGALALVEGKCILHALLWTRRVQRAPFCLIDCIEHFSNFFLFLESWNPGRYASVYNPVEMLVWRCCQSPKFCPKCGSIPTSADFQPQLTRLLRSSLFPPATMARTQAALRKWLYLRKTLATNPITINLARTNGFTPSANLLQAGDLAVHSARPFHNTSSKHAKPRPAPAARRARESKRQTAIFQATWNAERRAEKGIDHTGMFFECLGNIKQEFVGTVESVIAKHEAETRWAYAAAIKDGLIPSAISESTYRDVGTQLIRAAFATEPDRLAIRKISTGEYPLRQDDID